MQNFQKNLNIECEILFNKSSKKTKMLYFESIT